MEKIFIGVREVDEETFRKFRAKAVQEKIKLGMALTKAMQKWLDEKKEEKPKKIRLPQVKPFSFGPGTENLSSQIDKIVYGL